MENIKIYPETDAINSILAALDKLEENKRERVLKFVCDTLNIRFDTDRERPFGPAAPGGKTGGGGEVDTSELGQIIDIKTLKNQKNPSSGIEMAALVAFYLKHHAAESDRKNTVNAVDIEKYFGQARFKLPKRSIDVLHNAKNAGYLDPVGGGEFKLNAVGHNLIALNLPRKESSGSKPRSSRKKRTSTNKAGKGKRAK